MVRLLPSPPVCLLFTLPPGGYQGAFCPECLVKDTGEERHLVAAVWVSGKTMTLALWKLF